MNKNIIDKERIEKLNYVLKNHSDADFLFELYNLATSFGFYDISVSSSLTREGLYKTLSPHSYARWDSLRRIINAMGLDIQLINHIKVKNSEEYIRADSLKYSHSSIANEWHPTKNGDLKPNDVMAESHKKIWWVCDEGHEWKDYIVSRTKKYKRCPRCAAIQFLRDERDDKIVD